MNPDRNAHEYMLAVRPARAKWKKPLHGLNHQAEVFAVVMRISSAVQEKRQIFVILLAFCDHT